MRGKIILLLLLSSIAPKIALGVAPSVSSSSGTVSTGHVLTLTGSGFGVIPAYTYRDFNDTWDTEHSYNTYAYEVDAGEYEGIHWHLGVSGNRADGVAVDLQGISRLTGLSNYSTGYVMRKGIYWVDIASSVFENGFRAKLNNAESELYIIFYVKYGDDITAWPNPFDEIQSKIAYIWLNLATGKGNRQFIPAASGTHTATLLNGQEEFIIGSASNEHLDFIWGKWVKFKIHLKLNTWSAWINISSIARSENVVTVDTVAPHGLSSDSYINIKDCITTSFNTVDAYSTSPKKITVTDLDTFTYSQIGSNESASNGSVCGTKPDGIIEAWWNDTKIWDQSNVPVEDFPDNNTISEITLGANFTGDIPGKCYEANIDDRRGGVCDWLPVGVEVYQYYDDLIVSGTDPGIYGIPFVYISSSPTWGVGPTDVLNGDATFVRQVVGGADAADYGFKSWSDTSLKFIFNPGALSSQYYLYVTNWAGETNANGYAISAGAMYIGTSGAISIGSGGTVTLQ